MRLLLLLALFGFVAISLVSATPQRLKRQAPSGDIEPVEDDGEDDSTDVEPVEGEVPAVNPVPEVPTEDGETDVDEPDAEIPIPEGPVAEEPTDTGCDKPKGGRRDGKKCRKNGGRGRGGRAPNRRSSRSKSVSRAAKSRAVNSRERKSQKSSRGKRQ